MSTNSFTPEFPRVEDLLRRYQGLIAKRAEAKFLLSQYTPCVEDPAYCRRWMAKIGGYVPTDPEVENMQRVMRDAMKQIISMLRQTEYA